MSKLEKLSILGVRCFDNTKAEYIKFFTPLTLIVGFNGSGKTTIIECLKYAATGDLPPNSKGGAFIHDPKLCGEREVLAQVRMQFTAQNGAVLTATRNLQLTVKKGTVQQKTLECTLNMARNGERTSLSQRVAQLDQLIPEYLGVSRAIIDNVIFCHQDDSLWPLSEPATLKKKFDAIFEAEKYTKAVEHLKTLRKRYREELEQQKLTETHCKEDKEKGDKIERRSRVLHAEVEELREKWKTLNEQVKEVSQATQEAWDVAARYGAVVAELEGRRLQAQSKESIVDHLSRNMNKMNETDKELQKILSNYEEQIAEYELNLVSKTKEYHDLDAKLRESRKEMGSKQSQLGRLEAEKAYNERQIENRQNLVKELARTHDVRGFDHSLRDDEIAEFLNRIVRMSKDQRQALESAKREFEDERSQVQQSLNGLTEKKLGLNQKKDSARTQISVNSRKVAAIQAEINKLNINEGSEALLQRKLDNTDASLKQSKETYEKAGWDEKIGSAQANLDHHEQQAEQLHADISEATKNASETAQLDVVKKTRTEVERSLDVLKGAHTQRLSDVVGSHWEPKNLEELYQQVVGENDAQLQEAIKQRDGAARELEQIEYELAGSKSKLDKKKSEKERHRQILRDTIYDSPEEYPSQLQEAENNLYKSKENLGFHEFLRSSMKVLEEKGCCRLCQRGFGKDAERKQFKTRLENYISEDVQGDVTNAQEELEKLQNVRSSYDAWIKLRDDEIPQLETEGSQLQPRREALLSRVEKGDLEVDKRQNAKSDIGSLVKTVQNITRDYTELARLDTSIQTMAARQTQFGAGKSLEDIQSQLQAVNENTRSAKSQLANLTKDRDRARSRINELEVEIRDARSELVQATQNVKEKSRLDNQLAELNDSNNESHELIKTYDQELQALLPEISQGETKLLDINDRARKQESALQTKANNLLDSVNTLSAADREIKSYRERDGPGQLRECEREIQSLASSTEELEKDQKRVTTEVNGLKESQKSHETRRVDIENNLNYRKSLRELEEIYKAISELESHNAEADRDQYQEVAHQKQQERNKLSAEQATVTGEMRSKDDELQRLLNDWEADYKDARFKYREAHVKVETTKAAVEDLGRYGTALDRAIMEFHSRKMNQINAIVEELWTQTYQGTDVERIVIRSDNENLKGNKSYHYRVSMVKNDVEMDMRGRCSAGQKVLASIIIRLALAECFGAHCGMIALDEPTTNLDGYNIRALASSLHSLIQTRQRQSNFQLIVITHDEEFLRHMQCADFVDDYYRISRNEKQCSEVRKQSIAGVM